MRAALISMVGQPGAGESGAGAVTVGGKTLARRQLDFALAAGCERVIVLGDGRSPEAHGLRHAAEAAGARFHAIGGSTGLLGAMGAADQLLVLAPGLLPEAAEPLAAFRRGAAVLVLPAGPGVRAGFERIDLERAWASAALLPGALVERIAGLPEDIDPASALMRAALQARVPEQALPEALVAQGRWTMLAREADASTAERSWLQRHSPLLRALPEALADRVASLATRALASPGIGLWLAVAAAAALAGAVVAAATGWAALAFALIALAVLLGGGAAELARLQSMPFGPSRRRFERTLAGVTDFAFLACAIWAIEGDWLQRLFPPLVLLAALHLPAGSALPPIARNRALLAALLALAAGFGLAEPAIMVTALLLLALTIFRAGAGAPITRD